MVLSKLDLNDEQKEEERRMNIIIIISWMNTNILKKIDES